MFKKKKYQIFDFLIISLRIIPAQSFFAIVYAVLEALMPAYQTLVIGHFINVAMEVFSGNSDYISVLTPILLIMAYIMFTNLMPSIANIINLSGRNKLSVVLNNEMIRKRASLEYRHIEKSEIQDLIHRVCMDIEGRVMEGFNNLLNISKLIITLISLLAIIMSSTVSGGVLIMIAGIPLVILAMKTGTKNYEMDIEAKRVQRKYNYLTEVLTERNFASERILFDYSEKLQRDFNELYTQSFHIESKIIRKIYTNMKSGAIFMLLIVAIFILLLLPALQDGKMSIGIFIALVNVLLNLVHRMARQLSWVMSDHAKVKEYLKDFTTFIMLSEKKDAQSSLVINENFKLQEIEFKNVSFKYPYTENYILKDCSFVLSSQYNYAFVGINGAGKSTLLKLLTGQYEDFEGEILINGKDIRDYDYQTLKSLIAVVFQDFARLELTLEQNITIGCGMKVDKEKMGSVLSALELDEWINKLPNKLDTPLGKLKENAIDISGGQWQRIALARLLYSDHPINILDEPTSALDPIAESNVYEMFSKANQNRFTIYITHRLGAAKMADQILVLNEGRIVEQGSHKQIMSNYKGLYYRMFESQKYWYEISDSTSLKVEGSL